MLSNTDKQIISHLRKNARVPLTRLAEKLGMPISTIYDKVKHHEQNIIKKHTCLLDFPKLGYQAKTYIAVKLKDNPNKTANKTDARKLLQEFLFTNSNVNSLYRINYGHDFLVECIFRNIGEAEEFAEHLESKFEIEKLHKFNIVNELKKEEFLI